MLDIACTTISMACNLANILFVKYYHKYQHTKQCVSTINKSGGTTVRGNNCPGERLSAGIIVRGNNCIEGTNVRCGKLMRELLSATRKKHGERTYGGKCPGFKKYRCILVLAEIKPETADGRWMVHVVYYSLLFYNVQSMESF